MTSKSLRLLFLPREAFPTSRVRLTVLFGRELLPRGHKVDFVMQAANQSIETGRQCWSGNVVRVGPTDDAHGFLHRLRKHWLGLRHDLVWLWHAAPEHYDAILVSDKFLVAIAALMIARIRKIKFFYWMTFPLHKANVSLGREGIRRYPLVSMIRGYISEFSLKHLIIPYSDHIFVQSQRMQENFEDLGASREKMTPIVTGIDVTEVAPPHSVAPCDEKRHLTIAYLGTLASERRLEVLVDMLALLRSKGVTANLLLIGDGEVSEDQLRIRRRAEQLGLQEQIEITGFLPRAEALERLRGADVCVSPIYPSPLFDGGSPTKLVEYMAAGLPVVANRHPDQDQVLRESRAGISVPWGARHFARAVHRLLACTDTERKVIGMRGQTWVVKHRSYAVIADDFERSCLRTLSIGTTAR